MRLTRFRSRRGTWDREQRHTEGGRLGRRSKTVRVASSSPEAGEVREAA